MIEPAIEVRRQPQIFQHDLLDLLELHDSGQNVIWPEGYDEALARQFVSFITDADSSNELTGASISIVASSLASSSLERPQLHGQRAEERIISPPACLKSAHTELRTDQLSGRSVRSGGFPSSDHIEPEFITSLRELLALHQSGESVHWPIGYTAHTVELFLKNIEQEGSPSGMDEQMP